MAMREIDALGAAIVATEKEIAGEAWGVEESVLDESGDRSIEQMGEGLEGQHEPDDDEEEPEVEAEGDESETEGEQDGEREIEAKEAEGDKSKEAEADKREPEGRVPPGRLREQTEARKAAEAERDRVKAELETVQTNSRKENEALAARLAALETLIRQQQPAPKPDTPAPKPRPDLFEQPQEFVDHLTSEFQSELSKRDQQLEALRLEQSLGLAHVLHRETFSAAWDAVQKLDPRNPDNQITVRRIMTSANPGESLVQWHKRNETLARVGDDPAKYEERIKAEVRDSLMKDPEFRKQLVESMTAEARGANDGKPNTLTRLPVSLNGARGGNQGRNADPLMYDDSDQAVADSAWR